MDATRIDLKSCLATCPLLGIRRAPCVDNTQSLRFEYRATDTVPTRGLANEAEKQRKIFRIVYTYYHKKGSF